ncbi:MAG: hypothetical protein COB85_01905 [Bacteroidetes bacterium]|nr:MAG: hypothetical protein COB85_01905 [Bacteroidota bacterium]
MKNRILLICVFVSGFAALQAQQLPQYSQYLINDYVLNPAIGGSHDYFEAKSNNRFQWTGITDAPRTFILSMHGPLKYENMGIGGYIFTDVTGPTSRFGVYMSYAYHIKLTEKMKLSLGLFGGMLQYNVDGSKISMVDKGDPLSNQGVQSVYLPDAGFGLYWYTDKFYVGASVPQLLQNKLKLSDTTDILGTLKSHFYVTAGYKFQAGDKFQIEPSVLMKYVDPTPVQFDISARVIYDKMIWLGVSYRTMDAISFLLGYSYKELLMFGYSYDYTTTELQNYSSGTHEIMIGFRFISKKKEDKPVSDAMY